MTRHLTAGLVVCLATLVTGDVQAGKYNPTLSIGDKAPAWEKLPNVDGKTVSLADLADKEVVVVVFTCNTCPYAVDYEDRLNAFTEKYGAEGKVALVAINVNKVSGDLPSAMKTRAEEKKFLFPYLFDETQKIAKDYGATRTPEFFVLNKDRVVVYMGAMDDSADRLKVSKNYLDDVVTALLKGSEIKVTETPPVGCGIRFERSRRSK